MVLSTLIFNTFFLLCAISHQHIFSSVTSEETDISINGELITPNPDRIKMTARFINTINSTIYLWSYDSSIKDDPTMHTSIAYGTCYFINFYVDFIFI